MTVFREDVTAQIPQLRAFARSLTSGDNAAADDLVQDTLVNALRAQDQFDAGTNLKAWLFTIMRNRFFSVRSRKHVQSEVASDDLESLSVVAPPQEAHIEVAAFKAAFRGLSAQHREVLIMSVIQGMSYEEIASVCGCEVGTVKSRVNRARAALRTKLLDDDEKEDVSQKPRRSQARPVRHYAPHQHLM